MRSPHTARLGLVFYGADELRNYRGGAFVADHVGNTIWRVTTR